MSDAGMPLGRPGICRDNPSVGGEPAAATLVLKVGYRGAGFAGFAVQPGQRTVAGELVSGLETLLRRPVELTCAGRTDAGVHAIAQYVSMPMAPSELALDGRRILRGMGALVPDDISVMAAYQAGPSFSARFDAVSRTYRYRICPGIVRPVLAWDHAWWLRDSLDAAAMEEAAQALVGEHDFVSFCKATSAVGRPTCRYVDMLEVSEVEECGERLIAIDIRGNAFLHSMVRSIAGTLVEVGRGRRDPAWVGEVLEARDRCAAGPCAPAKGLTFVAVDYPSSSLVPWK